MKSILTYLNMSNVSHPAASDIELGLKVNEQISLALFTKITSLFENEYVTFTCNHNGFESIIDVVSETSRLQLSINDDKFTSKFQQNDVLHSANESFNQKNIAAKLDKIIQNA